jgi:signal transduction histidine kinase
VSQSEPLSIRWWLGGLVAAVGLPLLILLVWMHALQVRRERVEAQEQASRMLTRAGTSLRTAHAASLALLQRVASRPAVRDFDGSNCDSAFVLVDILPEYVNLFLFDASGARVCAGTPDVADVEISQLAEQWIAREIRSGGLRPGHPVLRRAGSRWITIVPHSVTGREGEPHGMLALVETTRLFDESALPAAGVITILDRTGTVIARSNDAERWIGRSARGTDITDLAMREKSGVAEAKGVDGIQRQYAFQYLPELDWYIYAGIPTTIVMKPVRETFMRGLAGGVIIVIIVIIITAVLSRMIERPLAALVRAAESVTRGAYDGVATTEGPREVATLARSFNHMIRVRALAEQRAHDDEKKLKALSDRLLTVQEEERSRIARELHDDLGQSLTALKMDVIGLLEKAARGTGPSAIAERILRTLDATVTSVQRISSELRPSVLDDLGLGVALESEARVFEERTGIECELSLPADIAIGPRAATAIYRIVQEALTNVARHSEATRVEIRIRERSRELLLEIRDDGRGITAEEAAHPSSLGLLGIRERADGIGGSVLFEGVPDRGTIISVRIPTPQTAEAST